tara:strand:+ start:1676 stop:2563 length:888 start_codon:yes stop_codon:yes gene_type:complete
MFEFDDAFEILAGESPSEDLGFLSNWDPEVFPSPFDASGNTIIGDPLNEASFHDMQTGADTCAIVSQKMILEQFGIDISENELTYEAFVNGWYSPGQGTPMIYVSELLDSHGVDTHTISNASISDLIDELNQGHKVIIGVDSSELVSPDSPLSEFLDGECPDHAVVVTGMSFDDNGEPIVYLNDPAYPVGGRPVPLSVLAAAWQDSGNHLIATDNAPADLSDHSVFGECFNNDSGNYKDESYWDSWHSKFAVIRAGVIGAAATGAVFSAIKSKSNEAKNCKSLSDEERNSLLKAI